MSLKNDLKEIEELVEKYRTQLKDLSEKITDSEEELGDVKTIEAADEIKRSISSLEMKKHRLEDHVFTLEIKKAELQYAQQDNSKKNTLARNSMYASIVLTAIIIVLTFFQVKTNYDLVAIGIVEAIFEKEQLEAQVKDLEIVCKPLLDREEKSRFDTLFAKSDESLRKIDSKIEKLKSEFSGRIEEVRKGK